MIAFDQLNYWLGPHLKYWLGLFNISLVGLILVKIGLDWLISIRIGYSQSRAVNISLDGLNVKNCWLVLARTG